MVLRREFLKATCAVAGSAFLPAWHSTNLFADASTDVESSTAGAIAQWVGSKIGNQLGTLAVDDALGYLGLDPNANLSGTLDEINQKLDQILSQLDELNTKVDALQLSINQLTTDVDVGIKQALAGISDSKLVDNFGWIKTKLGSRTNRSSDSFYAIMHLPPSGTSGVHDRGTNFVHLQQEILEKIRSIHYILTIRAGSSESLIQKWATLVTARLHGRGTGASLSGYAAIYEAWFTQAVSYQIKAYVMLLFIAGKNTEQQDTVRQDMLALLNEECAEYLDGLDRLVLSAAHPCPSGPTINTLQQPQWAPGSSEAMLRADVYTRALTSSFDGDLQTPQAQKISGVYGRIVLRPSDLTPDGKAPDHIAFQPYPIVSNYWPWTKQPGLATLGAVTEFQGVDWDLSSSAYGSLKSGSRSALRFARYFWPTPAHPRDNARDFQPFGYLIEHYTDRPLTMNPDTREYFTYTRPQGRVGLPIYRKDAKVMFFSIGVLAQLVLQRGLRFGFYYRNGLPVSSDSSDPYVLFGKTCAFVIGFLDGWSGPGSGPSYAASAPQGVQHTAMTGSRYLSWVDVNAAMLRPHLLQSDTVALLADVESRSALRSSAKWLDFTAIAQSSWTDRPATNTKIYLDHWISEQNGTGSANFPLFHTASDESGVIELNVGGNLVLTPIATCEGVTFTTSVRLLIENDRGTAPYLLYTLAESGPFGGQFLLPVGNSTTSALQPNTRYSLVIAVDISAGFRWNTRYSPYDIYLPDTPLFPSSGDIQTKVELALTELAISRPPGTGYVPA